MKTILALTIVIAYLFSACAPSQAAIQKAIQETAAAQYTPTASSTVTNTPLPPTETPTPTPPPCSDIAKDWIKETDLILTRWVDASKLANNTARIQLAGPIAELQQVRRDYQAVETPACAKDTRDLLITSMDNAIDGFLAFQAKEGDAKVNGLFDTATHFAKEFRTEYDRIKAEAGE